MKQLKALGFPSNKIVDGRVFMVENLDISRLLNESVVCGVLGNKSCISCEPSTYIRIYTFKSTKVTIKLGRQSYIGKAGLEECVSEKGSIILGNFSSLAWNILFELDLNKRHDCTCVSQHIFPEFNWKVPDNVQLFFLNHAK